MEIKSNPLRAIDLYSGVGGWSLGLSLAGIDVVASYERWGAANETNFKNNHHDAHTVDIRRLSLSDLPANVDVVVGSPPCTQFSYSNRGGSGDIEDGLTDIIKFLEIVDHLKPRFWAMENVPRVASVIANEIKKGGKLEKFAHLSLSVFIVNMADYGVPQRRRRCIVTNVDLSILKIFAERVTRLTLGDVVTALAQPKIVDPIFGIEIASTELRDHDVEQPLNEEEERINRANKTLHPVYNKMSFPDPMDQPVRTITATCTRVSRESIVIKEPSFGSLRRLTIRERATLQGFPITYQFYATSYGLKLKMIGNAVPPAFSFLIGHAMLRTLPAKLPQLTDFRSKHVAPQPPAPVTSPDKAGTTYRPTRTFRFAIPSLRLASGVRFELSNTFDGAVPSWRVVFIFGTPKKILPISLDEQLLELLLSRLPIELEDRVHAELSSITAYIRDADISRMQSVWSHTGPGATRPFMLLDFLDGKGKILANMLEKWKSFAAEEIVKVVDLQYGPASSALPGKEKLARHAPLILAGILIGSSANKELSLKPGSPVRQIRKALGKI